MKGLMLSEQFYYEFGVPMLNEAFPDCQHLLAAGLVGSGSDCFGFDDEVSQDHDFEPGFCLFLPGEDLIDRQTAFAIERAYAKLPKTFMGFKRQVVSPVGGQRHGVIRIHDFLMEKTGTPDGQLTLKDWFSVPEQSLAEATNGKIFRDDSGYFTAIRQNLAYLPEDVRLKKLAGHLLIMGQAGQYNYKRCVSRNETAAAQLAVIEFAKSALHAVFLLNKRYMFYYKWCFRALSELPLLADLYEPLSYLISSGNEKEESDKKTQLIEQICAAIIKVLHSHQLSDFQAAAMEGQAYSVNNKISNAEIRNLHILYGV